MTTFHVTPLPVAGSVVGGLVVMDEIGRGAQNVIYRARRDGETYALKVLRQPASADEAGRDFRREAAMLASLRHPGLVRIHEVGESDGRPYLLMELLRGQTLRSALDGGGAWDEAAAVGLAGAAAGALAAAGRRRNWWASCAPARPWFPTTWPRSSAPAWWWRTRMDATPFHRLRPC